MAANCLSFDITDIKTCEYVTVIIHDVQYQAQSIVDMVIVASLGN